MKHIHPTVPLRFCMAFAVVLVGTAAVRADDTAAQDKAAITRAAEGFVDAFRRGDADALAAFWAPEGDYVQISGRVLKGRKAIADEFREMFAEHKGLTLRIDRSSLKFPTPDTAVEDGVTSIISPEGGVPNRARYSNLLVKRDGQWRIESVHETVYEPPSNVEYLRPLEWIAGEWVEDGKEGPITRVLFEWTPDQNFIIGSRAIAVKDRLLDNGALRIGWDPAAKLIRAWEFAADGGFGEGAWKKDGDKWVITISAVLRSGSLMTATTVVTRLDANTITWQTKDQQVDGKPLADTPVMKMKRVQ